MNHKLNLLQEAQHEFWLNNLHVLLDFVESLPDESLALDVFNDEKPNGTPKKPKIEKVCGSVACIGGWVAVMPHFNVLGIARNKDNGAPMYGTNDDESVSKASTFLFGIPDMFDARDCDADPDKTDREIAIRRIKKRMKKIQKLEVKRVTAF